jgi:uncharacterized delta-60 repeat protein
MKLSSSALVLAVLTGCGKVEAPIPDAPPVEASITVDPVVRVRQGSQTLVEVAIDRATLDGDVAISIEGLPSGVTAEPVTLGAQTSSGSLAVRAQATAADGGPIAVSLLVGEIRIPLRLYVAGAPGAFDRSFSADGQTIVSSDDPIHEDGARELLIDPEGRIVLGGVIQGAGPDRGVLLYRLTPDGANDLAFGDGGRVVIPTKLELHGIFPHPTAGYVALTGDGVSRFGMRFDDRGAELGATPTTLVRGSTRTAEVEGGFVFGGAGVVEKFTFEGVLDPSFGTAGTVSTPTSGALAVDHQGRLVATAALRLGRFLPDGAVDPAFVVEFTPPANRDRAVPRGIGIDADNGGVLCGEWRAVGATELFPVLLRFRNDGTIDDGFGTGGALEILGAAQGVCRTATYLADGRILLSGERILSSTTRQAELWMVDADGTFDTGFGTNGVLLVPNNDNGAMRLDVEGGRVLLAGSRSGSDSLYVARIWL